MDTAMTYQSIWENLSAIDVSKHIEKKGNMSYLSWAWAWGVLMSEYPSARYIFEQTSTLEDGSAEVWCTVYIGECHREMWLPVMDHRNNSIIKPSSRQISDTRMRCLVKCLAMFGLGHYIYAGEDLPDPEVAQAKIEADKAAFAAEQERIYKELCLKLSDSIDAIKVGIAEGNLSAAAEAWFELTEDEKAGLWKAPSKGGIFTTAEREIMKSKEFRESHFGGQE